MQIVDVNLVFDRVPAEIVSRSINEALFDPGAGQRYGEAKRMMLAAVRAFRSGRSAVTSTGDWQGNGVWLG